MKITKEDIEKYGTEKEKEVLKEAAGKTVYVLWWEDSWEGDQLQGVFSDLIQARKGMEKLKKNPDHETNSSGVPGRFSIYSVPLNQEFLTNDWPIPTPVFRQRIDKKKK